MRVEALCKTENVTALGTYTMEATYFRSTTTTWANTTVPTKAFPDGGLRIQGAYSNGKEIGEWIVFNKRPAPRAVPPL